MTIVDIVARSGRSLKAARLRTILTAMAIAVGGFTLCLTLAAGNGVREYTQNLVSSNFDPAELLVGRDREVSNTGSPKSTPQEYDETITSLQNGGQGSFQIKQVTRDDINILKAQEGVEEVRENYVLAVRYITREGQKKYTGSAQAYNPGQKPEVTTGVVPSSGDIAQGDVLLPESYLDSLGFSSAQDAIGKKVTIVAQQPFSLDTISELLSGGTNDSQALIKAGQESLKNQDKTYTFTVGAVTRKPATSLTFGVQPLQISSIDAKQIYDFITKGSAGYDQYMFVSVRVKDGSVKTNRDTVKKALEDKAFYVMSSEDIQKTITQFVDVLQGVVAALGSITLIASIFGIVNTQYISVLERTREIGLIKALGMSRRKVMQLFIFEAMWIGFIGGVLGIVFGYIVGLLLNPVISKLLNLADGQNLIVFSFAQMLLLLGILMMVAAIAGLLPARKAAKLDPVEALRSE